MKCWIKRLNSDAYFEKHVGVEMCPNKWTYKSEAKLFDSVAEARATIKVYKLKNCEVEKCTK